MNIYRQRDIVLVCGLTTNLRPAPYTIIIGTGDIEKSGTLRHRSKIKADTIASLDQSLLIKQIARLKPSVFNQVVVEIETLIRQP
jgi:mRNA-degrading endonuclease toxin of MazEF toxin-antitoxin module